MRQKKEKKDCLRCKTVFLTANPRRKYCEPHCAKMVWWEKKKEIIRRAQELVAGLS